MRIQVPLEIEMTDKQVVAYGARHGLPAEGGRLRAKDVVDDVRRRALTLVRDSAVFGEAGGDRGERAAEVRIKR